MAIAVWEDAAHGVQAPTQRYCWVVIPPFDNSGNLPAGVHTATWEQIVERFGTNARRRELLHGLLDALRRLRSAGCCQAFLDGSFVTGKETPGDFDVCWDVTGVDGTELDPVFLTFDDGRAAQKAAFGGELFPAQAAADGLGTIYFHFFQQDSVTGEAKGIIQLDLGRLP